ncbi:oligosaccharide flippase family protein [Desulfovibrio subterraneus]|uniref:oligosaccharide flippase family protein n=1 Tax=Desulfovibrio subterraneus TaxID=2718620 RepID=UPI0022B89088|nr:oligosaccharide flippase family protein [Desulfovibrio subterraneus]WBF66168.1 oligosaccharide flippase family protein [Desulfovibrio subterraneus]
MSKKPSVLTSVMWNYASVVVSLLATFFVAPILVNGLGKSHYGIWSLVLSIISYYELMDFGIRTALVRFVAVAESEGDVKEMSEIVSTSFVYFIFVSFLMLVIGISLSFFVDRIFNVSPQDVELARTSLQLVTLFLAIRFPMNAFTGALVGIQRYDVMYSTSVIVMIVRSAAICFFVLQGYGLYSVVLVYGSCVVFVMLVNSLQAFKYVKGLSLSHKLASRSVFRKLRNFGSGVLLLGICKRVTSMSGPFVVGMVSTMSDVTYFSLAYAFIQYLSAFVTAGARVLIPRVASVSGASSEGKGGVSETSFAALRLTVIGTLLYCGGVLVAGSWFLDIWIGPGTGEHVFPVVVFLLLSAMFSQAAVAIMNLQIGAGNLHCIQYVSVVEALVLIGGGYLLGREYGARGVAMAYVINSILVQFPGYVYALYRQNGSAFIRKTLKSLGLLVALAVAVYLPAWLFVAGRNEALPVIAATAVSFTTFAALTLFLVLRMKPRDIFRLLKRKAG